MKSLKYYISAILIGGLTIAQSGCYGPFKLTKSIYDWNGEVSDNGIVRSLLFVGMVVIPVYGFSLFIDAIFLNSIEFWTGSNPVSLAPGEVEEQIVETHEGVFKLTATTNQLEIRQLEGEYAGKVVVMKYKETNNQWYLISGEKETLLTSLGSPAEVLRMN